MTGNPARDLAAMRKQVERRCAVCGTETLKLKTARYCSNACRQRAKYERQKAAKRRPPDVG
jgi:predicted nucleic acid-binding Zn ribbon protein